MHPDVFGRWQESLRGILSAYLDGDFLRVRSRWFFPLRWELSVFAVRRALTDLAYASQALRRYSGDSTVSTFLNHLDLAFERLSINPEDCFLAVLAEAYRLLDHLCQVTRHECRLEVVRTGPQFDAAQYLTIDSDYFAPVVRLVNFVQQQMSAYLTMALIHGSVADQTCCKGYSDLDTLLVISRDTVLDPERLRKFARIYYRSLVDLYRFDPLQHHGHMIMTAIDLDGYGENWLPLSVFSRAKYICQPSSEVLVSVRDSRRQALCTFESDADYFHLLKMRHWTPNDAYNFKYYLSNLMLLPTRYVQAKGVFCDKSDSFGLARQGLPDSVWDVLDYATRLRRDWPYARHGAVDILGRAVGRLNVQATRCVQDMLLGQQYHRVLRLFTPHCVEQSGDLVDQMFNDVYADKPKLTPICMPNRLEKWGNGRTLAIIHHPVDRTLDEYQWARERYVNRAKGVRGVTAIYEYGSVNAPGLSDLDFVVCMADAADEFDPESLAINSIPFGDRDLILHDAIIVPKSQIESVPEFLIGSNLHELWHCGPSSLPQKILDSQSVVYAKTAKLVEKLFSFQVWFTESLVNQTLDARWAIALLRSLVYTVLLTESVTGKAPNDGAAYAQAVDELRSHWFEESSLYRKNIVLRGLFECGQHLTNSLVEIMDEFLMTSGWLTAEGIAQNGKVTCPVPQSPVCVAFGSATEQTRHLAHTQPKDHLQLVTLPPSFLSTLSLYGRCVPYLAKMLTVYVPPCDVEPDVALYSGFERHLRERAHLLEIQTRFLVRHKFWFGSYLPQQLLDLSRRGN